MANAKSIANQISKALAKIGPPVRQVYLRRITYTGDRLIGRDTATKADTLFTPQPAYHQLSDGLTLSSNVQIPVGAYKLTLAADSLTTADLKNPALQIVLKDASDGSEEVLKISYFSRAQMFGGYLAISVYATQVKR